MSNDMRLRIVAVHPGPPTSVDTTVAGVQVRAEWRDRTSDVADHCRQGTTSTSA
jgi:hypothetical protein